MTKALAEAETRVSAIATITTLSNNNCNGSKLHNQKREKHKAEQQTASSQTKQSETTTPFLHVY